MKKNTLNVIILTLTLINLVLNVLIVFSVIPTANRTNNLVMKIAAIVDMELKPEYMQNPTALTVDQIDNRTITSADGKTSLTISVPSTDGKNHYVVTTVVVSLDKSNEDYAKLSESFTNANTLIASRVDAVISSYTFEQALTAKAEMQSKILEEVRALFQSNMIYDVSLQGFVVQ